MQLEKFLLATIFYYSSQDANVKYNPISIVFT